MDSNSNIDNLRLGRVIIRIVIKFIVFNNWLGQTLITDHLTFYFHMLPMKYFFTMRKTFNSPLPSVVILIPEISGSNGIKFHIFLDFHRTAWLLNVALFRLQIWPEKQVKEVCYMQKNPNCLCQWCISRVAWKL